MLRQALALFKKSDTIEAADRILSAVTAVARDPSLFGEGRAPDTLDGRFEVAVSFACLAILRLRAAPEAERVAQVFTDRLFRLFDAGLREAGVGDLSVPKRMKKLAGVFYGRLNAYGAMLQDAHGEPALAAALSRYIWSQPDHPFAPELAGRLAATWGRLQTLPPQALESVQSWRGAESE